MKKEYRGKFGNFVHEERKKEKETLDENITEETNNEVKVLFVRSFSGISY